MRMALIGLLAVSASACLVSIGGCSSAEASALNEVEHYGGAELVAEDDGLGSCGATFSTGDDPDLVIEHCRSKLQSAGWTIDPPQPSPPPVPSEDGVDVGSISLSAHKGTMGYVVSPETFGATETTFVIHVGEAN